MHHWSPLKRFKLFADCIPVKGALRSTICDLTRNRYKFIPNELFELINKFEGKTKEEILNSYGLENNIILEQYFDFLEANEFIFWCDESEITFFPKLDLTWQRPSQITNIIIDINFESNHDYKDIFQQLETLNCQDIQFRCFTFKSVDYWEDLLQHTLTARVRSIEILTQWGMDIDVNKLVELIEKHLRIRSFILHSAPKYQLFKMGNNGMGNLVTVIDKISDNSHCGQVHWNYFTVNIGTFTEAQKYNTCLNRKVSIDVNGDIKNCPSFLPSYGNIKKDKLSDAIDKKGFKDFWVINKDQVHICKDCEFRYICTDCRVFLQDQNDLYSKPVKCSYNPFTATWEDGM